MNTRFIWFELEVIVVLEYRWSGVTVAGIRFDAVKRIFNSFTHISMVIMITTIIIIIICSFSQIYKWNEIEAINDYHDDEDDCESQFRG